MKKKIVSLALAVCLLAIAAVGTLAYFTDNDEAKNEFTVGNVSIDLTEPNWEGNGSKDAPEVYPGEPLAKDPIVTNDGANPCFVRVKVTNLDQFGNKGAITLRYKYADGYNTADWTLKDGYYYYNGVLAVGDTTTPVFDQIVMPTGLTGNEPTQSIDVIAEAVQAQGARPSFAAVQTMTVDEIAAWFTTCMPANNG